MAWGMTVAPSIEAATRRESAPRSRGMRPAAVCPQSGGETKRPPTKPMVMMTSKPTTMPSKVRWERRSWISSRPIETTPTMQPPASSGRPKSRWRAIAPPITSARSVAMATSSAWRKKAILLAGLIRGRRAWGRERPVTMPSLALWYWMSTAMALARTSTHTSR